MRAAVDSGCNKSAQLMCGLSTRRVPIAVEVHGVVALLGRWSGGQYIPICPSGRNLGE